MLDGIEPNIDTALFETCLAVTEVIVPQPLEALIEAKGCDGGPAGMKPLAPLPQRSCIRWPEVFYLLYLQPGRGDRSDERWLERQESPWEYIFLDKVDAAAIASETLVLNGNDLQN